MMKKNTYVSMILAMVLLLSGCASKNETPPEPVQPDSEQPTSDPAGPSAIPPAKGTVKTFQYDDFALEVSNVKEIKQGSSYDGMETWEYDIYVVYPGAIATVLNADTFIDEETDLPHADWAFLTSDSEEIDIMDGMEPLEITEAILGVFDPESSVYVLGFEVYNDHEGPIVAWEHSDIYTDADIEAAMDAVTTYFDAELQGCTLKELRYPGDASSDLFAEWAEEYEADEAIVLDSSFVTDASGGDGSLEPNAAYDHWQWILTGDNGGIWEVKTYGYG